MTRPIYYVYTKPIHKVLTYLESHGIEVEIRTSGTYNYVLTGTCRETFWKRVFSEELEHILKHLNEGCGRCLGTVSFTEDHKFTYTIRMVLQ